MKERYYELIDERVFEQELEMVYDYYYPQTRFSKDICHLHYTIWFIR
ncbi:Uncharacterised protein [Staphylococcus aureus]|nr:Uncharacterised protein [Staphylococcus aureus]